MRQWQNTLVRITREGYKARSLSFSDTVVPFGGDTELARWLEVRDMDGTDDVGEACRSNTECTDAPAPGIAIGFDAPLMGR